VVLGNQNHIIFRILLKYYFLIYYKILSILSPLIKKKMKAINLIIASILVASCALFIGCKSSANKVEDAREDVVKANEDVAKANETLEVAKEEYLEDVRQSRITASERVDANNRSLAEFREKIAKEKRQTKEKYEKQIAELEQKNNG
jgi:hypothetical protein